MRIIFMGSADLSCPCLELLASGPDKVVGVVTQPDRPKGRNLVLTPSPVRRLAEIRNIRVFTPEKVNAPDSVEALKGLAPDLVVVVAYGQILRPAILKMPGQGCLNIHTSLLPKYRGAAPIQWAILNGDQSTGVTSMFMSEKMDAGDIIYQSGVRIEADDTGGSLHDKLAIEAAVLLGRTLDSLRAGPLPRRPQVEADVTFVPKLTKKDGRLDWALPAVRICDRIRAFNPWPCCHCEAPKGGRLFRVLRSRVEAVQGLPGQVVDVSGDGPLIACGQDGVRLIEVQPEGKKVMGGAEYLRGHGLKVGEFLG